MNYATNTKQDMLNGDGIRAVFWVTGCSHLCKGCHNPETWDENYGQLVTKDTYKELALALEPDYISGVTWSGGDPLYCGNRKELENLIMFVHDNFQKTQWLYTGYVWEDIKDLEIMKYIDKYWGWVLLLAPVGLIVLGAMDFVKATTNGDSDAIKKASSSFIKRAIAVLLLFLLKPIVRMVFAIFGLEAHSCI